MVIYLTLFLMQQQKVLEGPEKELVTKTCVLLQRPSSSSQNTTQAFLKRKHGWFLWLLKLLFHVLSPLQD
jgi:hypothetical protein